MIEDDLKVSSPVKLQIVGTWEMIIVDINPNNKQALCAWHGSEGTPFDRWYPLKCLKLIQ